VVSIRRKRAGARISHGEHGGMHGSKRHEDLHNTHKPDRFPFRLVGTAWYGMVWYGMAWCGTVWQDYWEALQSNKHLSIRFVTSGSWTYKVDFSAMTQTNTTSNKSRPIRRVP
jgi:hypothetical protein